MISDTFQRYRSTPSIRHFMAETDLAPRHLIAPVFVGSVTEPIASLPDCYRYTPAAAVEEAKTLYNAGIRSLILFGTPDQYDTTGAVAATDTGVVQTSIKAIRQAVPDMIVMADLCLCQYLTHGACACLGDSGQIDLERTYRALGSIAQSYAAAGVHAVAPSGMIDGTIPQLRSALDAYPAVLIFSYAMKYHSAFYGPFRGATKTQYTPNQYSRSQHQIAPTQSREALRDALYDAANGADMLIVKPAGLYLDQIYRLRQSTDLPIAAYQVSGEYAMLMQAVSQGILPADIAFTECFIGMRRAGADWIISYYAKQWAHYYANQL